MTGAAQQSFSTALLDWYDLNGRKNLPWQGGKDPYRIWLSEIMLQQTQVATVIPYYQRFIGSFPDLKTLANASQDEVLAHWSGLGYYARARNLHRAANKIMTHHNGHFPQQLDSVIALPGIGRSTAGAILNFAFDQQHPILDGNVKRVLSRLHRISGWPGHKKTENQLWQLAAELTPLQRVSDYTQAIMDLGATLCTRSKPSCSHCPVSPHCQASKHGDIDQYPQSAPKRVRPTKQTWMLIIENQRGQLQLEKRPPTGIWGGLYSLPECQTETEITDQLSNQFGLNEITRHTLPTFTHRFSHFDLEIHPVHLLTDHANQEAIKEQHDYQWYELNVALDLGLPKPTSDLLSNLKLAADQC